jgi:hypothetical protein
VAAADKEEFPPLLPAGFHPMQVAGLRRLCVDRATGSFKRSGIMTRLETIIDSINKSAIRGQVWIDGSFMTEKLNPDDADIALMVDLASFRSMSPNQRLFFNGFASSSLYDSHRIDNYAQVIDESRPDGTWNLAYWIRQFGFSRSDQMKGIAVIDVPFVVAP